MIHIFERFDDEKSPRGEKWETIEWKTNNPTSVEKSGRYLTATYAIKNTDFRMPHRGYLYFPHPVEDSLAAEYEYDLPSLAIPDYKPGLIQNDSMTEQLKQAWMSLDDTRTLDITRSNCSSFTVNLKKEIVDPLEHSIDGYLYIYRPDIITIKVFMEVAD